jgi:carboxyl-terminal processing protease
MKNILNYMTSRKALVWWIPLALVFSFVAFKSFGKKAEPATKYEKIITTIAALLEQGHYSPKKIDDTFSKDVFWKFLDDVDPDKNILLQSDIDALKEYETKVDDELKGSKLQFVPALDAIYKKRVTEVTAIYNDILAKPFDFTKNETANLNGEKIPYPKNDAERKEYWRKRLKYEVLQRYADVLATREKNKGKADFVVKADSTLERESRDVVRKTTDRNFNRLQSKFTEEEKFNMYINTITAVMDPHTNFFPPVEKRAFDEQMSGQFYGIGAQLGQEQDGTIKIVSVITGSPAWKSGEVQANDVILKVAQGPDVPVDISGYETTDAVKLIRGKKGTEVRLTLKKTDGTIKVVPIVRDKIVQEETYARSAIVKKEDKKIGYIYLPEFYADFENPGGPRCARDVAIEIEKLKAENVDGIVMDLRNNGGGSLQDVIQMVGFFIEDGPVVQVRDKNGEPTVYRDKDKSVLYNGPLAVMINENSASASEIFAAAIQDYKRGIIVGSKSYGKGTVQRSVGVDKNIGFFVPATELGSLKITIQKFYRINGGSTQLKGVTPDVIMPDLYQYETYYNKEKKAELPWDEISKASFAPWNNNINLKAIDAAAQQQVSLDTTFTLINSNTQWLAKNREKDFELNLQKYQQNQATVREIVKKTENLLTLKDSLNMSFMTADENKINKMDQDKINRYKAWLSGLKKDIYLDETVNIVNSMIMQEKLAKKN